MLRVLSYNKELETEKLMKEKEQKLREPPRGWAPTTSRPKRKEDHNEVGHGAKTQILFLVQNVAYDDKFVVDYEVVKDQLPEERHLVPTKPLHPKKMTVQTDTEEASLIPDKEGRPSLHQTGQLWKIEQEGRARRTPQRPEETSSQPT